MSTKKPATANLAIALETLSVIRGGAAMEELVQAIQEATERTKRTRKASTVSLTIKIDTADKDDQDVDRVWVTDDIKTKLPAEPKKHTLLFIDHKNNLVKQDPQLSLFVGARPVEREPEQEARTVGKDAAAGEARSLAG
jgi:hypothetical protein